MNSLRRWLEGRVGKLATVVGTVLALGVAGFAVSSFLKGGTPDGAHYSMYICTETGKSFRHKNVLGETHPIHSPHSGRNTGVLAEPCYWTADGATRPEPTWVLLDESAGKPGPTFCPDCGRLVVGHNPPPRPGGKPPPTRQEYAARGAAKGAAARARDDDR